LKGNINFPFLGKFFYFSTFGGMIVKKVAVVSAILEEPELCQKEFNNIVSDYKSIIVGRMGIPMDEWKIAVISLTVVGPLDQINSLTGKLGNIPHVLVKTAISKKEL